MSRFSMMACSSFSSARYVRSITAPLRTFLSLVRTKAPPFPGLTCWNSTTLNRPSGRSRLMPFFKSLVETAMNVLRESGESAGAGLGDPQGVLDADAAVPGNIDTRLDGDDESGCEDSSAQLGHRRRFVDIEPDTVTRAVLEAGGPAGGRDDLAADVVDLFDTDPRLDGLRPRRLRRLHHVEDARELAGGVLVHAERPCHVRAVALEGGAEFDD